MCLRIERDGGAELAVHRQVKQDPYFCVAGNLNVVSKFQKQILSSTIAACACQNMPASIFLQD